MTRYEHTWKQLLSRELRKYGTLPFHLAVLYLHLKPEEHLWCGQWKMWLEGEELQLQRGVERFSGPLPETAKKGHGLHINTLCTFQEKAEPKKHVYLKNKQLKSLITDLTEHQSKTYAWGFEQFLIVPYLYFNREAGVKICLPCDFEPSQIFRWDREEQSIKTMKEGSGKTNFEMLTGRQAALRFYSTFNHDYKGSRIKVLPTIQLNSNPAGTDLADPTIQSNNFLAVPTPTNQLGNFLPWVRP